MPVPLSPEQWALVSLIVANIIGGIGNVWTWWSGRRVVKEKTEAERLEEAYTLLHAQYQAHIADLTKQRDDANGRFDGAVGGIQELTAIVGKQTAAQGTLTDEIRRTNVSNEQLVRDALRR